MLILEREFGFGGKKKILIIYQGDTSLFGGAGRQKKACLLPGLGSRSRVFLAPWSRSRSRLKKKSGAGAAKKLAGSSTMREDKKHKDIVL